MDFFKDLPNMEAVNYIVNKYSDSLPKAMHGRRCFRVKRRHKRDFCGHRHKGKRHFRFRPIYSPPYYTRRAFNTASVQAESVLNAENEHKLRESLNLINQNKQIYTDLYRATSNVDAQIILRESISVADFDLNSLRRVYYTAIPISPELCSNYASAVRNSIALKVLFINEAQILQNIHSLSKDASMQTNRTAIEAVMDNELNQLKRINQLNAL